MAIRTRFAPSPTGSLHVGGVRTALYNLLVARQTKGAFVLRIEDTDQARSTEEASRGLVRDMRWLGLNWDEGPERDNPQYGPYYQSQRLEIYQRYAKQLVEQGKAYYAWETNEELDAERKRAEAAKENFRYRRRPYTDEQIARFKAEGRKPVIRLVAPYKEITVHDEILGPVTLEAGGLDDFVLVKGDGFPTYHFAVVIDDHLMNIGLVLRGTEHLMNTHKHLAIYEAFGWTPPCHGHLPVILSPYPPADDEEAAHGGKMSKREKPKMARKAALEAAAARNELSNDWTWLAERTGLPVADVTAFMNKQTDLISTAEAIGKALGVQLPMIEVMDFRRGGYLPEALINYLALVGWSPGNNQEILSFSQLVEKFSIERVNTTAGQFDPEKLNWMNGEYMKSLSDEVLLERLAQWLEVVDSPIAGLDETRRRYLLAMYRKRARTFADIEKEGPFLFRAPTEYAAAQVDQHLRADGIAKLTAAREALTSVTDWSPAPIKAALEAAAATLGGKIGKVAQPVRIALTGTGVGPEIDLSLAFLGPDESIARIDRTIAYLKTLSG